MEERKSKVKVRSSKKNKEHKACQKMTVIYIIFMITDKYYWLRPDLKLFSDQFVIQICNQRYSLLGPHIFPFKSTVYITVCTEISVLLMFV